MPANRLVCEPHDGSRMVAWDIEQKADQEPEVALTDHPEVVSRVRRHAAQRLANLRSACGYEDLLLCAVSIAVLETVEIERNQEEFEPVSQRPRQRDPVEEADEPGRHTAGEIHERPIEASIAVATLRQEVAPPPKTRQGVL